jgi:hypothetical protein
VSATGSFIASSGLRFLCPPQAKKIMGSSPISGRGFFLPGLCLLPRAPYQELQEAFALLRPPLSRTPPLDARCRVPLAVRWVDSGSISGGYLRRLSPRDAFGSRSSYSAFVGALAPDESRPQALEICPPPCSSRRPF